MVQKKLVLAAIAAIAGLAAFRAYQVAGVASAIAALLIVAWTLFYLQVAENVLKAIGMMLNPFQTAVNFLLLGFLYASLTGRGFWEAAGIGVAASAVGVIVSMWLYKYWNIGS